METFENISAAAEAPETGVQGTETATVGDNSTQTVDASTQTQTPVQGSYTDDHANQLFDIEARIKKDPDTELSPEEQALYDAGTEGKLTAKQKQAQAAEQAQAATVLPEIEAAMKEVGAKTPQELVEKIQGLRKAVTGKDAQAYATLEGRFKEAEGFRQGEAQLYKDAAAGEQEAIDFILKERGLKVVPAGTMPAQTAPSQAATEIVIDPDVDALTGGVLTQFHTQNQSLKQQLAEQAAQVQKILQGTEAEKASRVQEYAEKTAKDSLITEMIEVSQFSDELKGIPDLKNRLIDFQFNGKDDAQITPYFNELFSVANDKQYGEGTTLKAAQLILKGKNADALIEKARKEGQAKAYNVTPNKSLSGVVASEGDTGLETVTEAQLDNFENGQLNALPKSWFDKENNFVKDKIPRKFHERLGIF